MLPLIAQKFLQQKQKFPAVTQNVTSQSNLCLKKKKEMGLSHSLTYLTNSLTKSKYEEKRNFSLH